MLAFLILDRISENVFRGCLLNVIEFLPCKTNNLPSKLEGSSTRVFFFRSIVFVVIIIKLPMLWFFVKLALTPLGSAAGAFEAGFFAFFFARVASYHATGTEGWLEGAIEHKQGAGNAKLDCLFLGD